MSKKIRILEKPANLTEARKILNKFNARIPPDIPCEVVVNLLTCLGVDFRSTKEGIIVESKFHVCFQHANGKFTVHRKGFSQVLRFARAKIEENPQTNFSSNMTA